MAWPDFNEPPRGLSRRRLSLGLLLLIGFIEKMLYTAPTNFGDIGVRIERQYHGHVTTQSDLRQQKRS